MKTLLLTICTTLLFGCNIEPQPINYGKDNCQFCKMTIMEPKFAAEIVTKKGKAFKFDDVSCMVKYMKAEDSTVETHSHVVVNDYDTNKFVNVSESSFIYSADFRSPMGGNVAAFSQNPPTAKGTTLTWKEVKSKF